MIRQKHLAGLALCGALLVAACASEEQHPRRYGAELVPTVSPDVFLFLPYAREDRRLTKAELSAAIAGNWRAVAGSGASIRLLELQDWFTKVEGAAASPFNPTEFVMDGGDTVSREGFAHALTQRFAALDKNKDGVLEPSEMMTMPRAVPRDSADGQTAEPGGGMHRRRRSEGGGSY
jgi:hypothetical protein